jgi:mRNA interferase MazF
LISPGKIAVLHSPGPTSFVLARLPGRYDDWLICMISSQVHQAVDGFDELIREVDDDFALSGLRVPSLIRIGRLAVVASDALAGAVGEVGSDRLARIRGRLSEWIRGAQ